MRFFFKNGNNFGILRLLGLGPKGRSHNGSFRVVFQETKKRDLEAASQVSGYGELEDGIDRKLSISKAVVKHS